MLARIWLRLGICAWVILSKGSVSEVSEIMKNEDQSVVDEVLVRPNQTVEPSRTAAP